MKIGQYLAKIWQEYSVLLFFETRCSSEKQLMSVEEGHTEHARYC